MCRSIYCVKPQQSSVPARTRESGAPSVTRPQNEMILVKKEIGRIWRAVRRLNKQLDKAKLTMDKVPILARILRLTADRKNLEGETRWSLILQ